MSSSSSSPPPAHSVPPELVPGGRVRDLRVSLAEVVTSADEEDLEEAAEEAFNDLLDEVSLGLCFDLHRAVKTGVYALTEVPETVNPRASLAPPGGGATDIFGQVITTAVGVPTLKKQPECICPNCQRNMAATRQDINHASVDPSFEIRW